MYQFWWQTIELIYKYVQAHGVKYDVFTWYISLNMYISFSDILQSCIILNSAHTYAGDNNPEYTPVPHFGYS